ncbi:MAG: flagellar hook protein FlgE [Bacillota bacterium]
MLRSLFSGVSGMRTHQLDMDVIADNIANVNTAGYKAGRMTFKQVYSQLLRGARGPLGNQGGINPLQVGLGVTTGSIDTLFTQGAPQATGRDTDLAIDGNGFFVLTTDGTTRYYTRSGNFSVDSGGNLVYANGMKVMGWNADPATGVVDTSQAIDALTLPITTTIPAQATSKVYLSGNLDSRTPINGTVTMSFDVYDSLGTSHALVLTFTKTDNNQWEIQAGDATLDGNPATGGLPIPISFDQSGAPQTPTSTGLPGLQFTLTNGASDIDIDLNWAAMTQYAQANNPTLASQNGYAPGYLVRFTIDDAGVLKGVFSNDLTRDLGQIALATFTNQEGLVKQSDTLFTVSGNTGTVTVGQPSSGNRGKLVPGFLEMSNVDLSQEFTNLILAQRGFQANSRVITTSDELLQELMTLKR